MELVKIAFYSLFLVIAIFLSLFNLLYTYRVKSVDYQIGFGMPKFLKRALEVNTVLCFTGTFIVAYILTQTLVSIEIQSIL